MDKDEIEIFLKNILNSLVDVKVFNDRSRKDSIYPYVVMDSSNISTQLYPRVDVDLTLNIWDKSQNYIKVNEIADIIQSALNRNSKVADNITATFYLNTRKNVDDEDKELKRVYMLFDVEIYQAEKEE
jgi:hypothetical protein|nr:MAG TPA_asm: hypothetical protein [Caudoviricetes sp.]